MSRGSQALCCLVALLAITVPFLLDRAGNTWLAVHANAEVFTDAKPYPAYGPWLRLLEERYGDREAARHFLNAHDASARITPEVGALAWVPHDIGVSRQLLLPYWYWTGGDPRWSDLVSPARGGVLLPPRYYARVVAAFGQQFRDNSGADGSRNRDHPGAQELMWGLGDYPVTPEAHMRQVRRLGGECLREAAQGLRRVKKNREEAAAVYNFMTAYQLLTDYYERKVLAATAALIYGFGGPESSKREAERFADEAVERYEAAINFIWEAIDRKAGKIKGKWLDGKALTLPELIERERRERKDLPALFSWAKRPRPGAGRGTGPRSGTYAPSGR